MFTKEKLVNDMKTAMKAREQGTLDAIRFLRAKIQEEEVKSGADLDEAGVIKVLQKQLKQREDSVAQYKNAGRDDLAEKESKEVEVIKRYLPQEMTDAELEAFCKEIIAEHGFSAKKDMGAAMKAATEKAEGRAPGKKLSAVFGKLLA